MDYNQMTDEQRQHERVFLMMYAWACNQGAGRHRGVCY